MKTINRFFIRFIFIFFLGVTGVLVASAQNYSANDGVNYDDGYSSGTVINNYYGSDYLYGISYASRIQRFHGGFYGLSYYSPWFTDYISYSYPGYWGLGLSAYPFSFNISWGWDNVFYNPYYYQSWGDPWFYSRYFPRVRIKVRNRYRGWYSTPSYYCFYNSYYRNPVYYSSRYSWGNRGYRYVPGLGYRSYSSARYEPAHRSVSYSSNRVNHQSPVRYNSNTRNNQVTGSRTITHVNNITVNNSNRNRNGNVNGNNRGNNTTSRGNSSQSQYRGSGNVHRTPGNKSTISRTVTNSSTVHRRTGSYTSARQNIPGRNQGNISRTSVSRGTVRSSQGTAPKRKSYQKPATSSGNSSYRRSSGNTTHRTQSVTRNQSHRSPQAHSSRNVSRSTVSRSHAVTRSSRGSSDQKAPARSPHG